MIDAQEMSKASITIQCLIQQPPFNNMGKIHNPTWREKMTSKAIQKYFEYLQKVVSRVELQKSEKTFH